METFILYQYVVLPIITNESIAQLPQAIHVLYRHHLPPHKKNETIVVLFAKMCVVQDFSKGHTRLELKKRVVRLKLILSKLLDSFGSILVHLGKYMHQRSSNLYIIRP